MDTETTAGVIYGLLDTEDRLWMGNGDGPLLFEDQEIAVVAAMICDRSLKQVLGRTRAVPYVAGALTLHDKKPVLIDPETALAQLEDGF